MKAGIRNWGLGVGVFLLSGCWGEKPACAPEALALLEANYVSEVLVSCDGYEKPEECPAYEPIKARYAQKREAWIQCQ